MGMVRVYTGGDPHDELAISLSAERWHEIAALLDPFTTEHYAAEVLRGMIAEAIDDDPKT